MKSALALTIAALETAFASAQHDQGAHASAAPAASTAATCPVSGDKLGAMGDPVNYVYKQAGKPDRTIQFCCDDCIKDFEKDPAKYLAKLDAKAPAAGTHEHAAGGHENAAAGPADTCCSVVDAYVPISEALAADDLAKAKASAAALVQEAEAAGLKSMARQAGVIAKADSLKSARDAFKGLSKEVTPMAQGVQGYVVMNCPMANADWVQTDAKVRNPYYGKMMLTCGAPKK